MRRLGLALALVLLSAASAPAQFSRVIQDHTGRFTANVGDIGATLTEIQAAPASNVAHHVVTIALGSSTATAGAFALRAGTGTNCGTNPVGVFPQPGVASPTLTMPYPANTVQPYVMTFAPPIRLPLGNALCIIGTATNLARGSVSGFTAP